MNSDRLTVTFPGAIPGALGHHEAGRLQDAEAIYRQVLAADPSNFDALFMLAVHAHQAAGTRQVALVEVEALYRHALESNPHSVKALNNLGNALKDQGKPEEAIASYHAALSFAPDLAEVHNNLGNALKDQGKLEEAIASYRTALSFKPDLAEAHDNLGTALRDQGKLEEAIASHRNALSCKPDYAGAHNNLGNALKDQGKLEEAIASYHKALSFAPDLAEAHNNLGAALRDQGKLEEAIASYRKALSFKPDLAEARWSIAMSKIPAVYGPGVAPSDCRAEFGIALADLDNWFRADRVNRGFNSVGSQQPYYLAYQEENNRDLLSRYGALCFRLMDDWLQRQDLKPPETGSTDITRLGIVSSHFHNHSVWDAFVKGWLQQLDRRRFQLHLFYLGTIQDDQTAFARRNATTFSDGKRSLRKWVETILAQQLDVLIYPEISMESTTVQLASMRLAPVQLSAWGHPETTGLPSIDYYISANGFEPHNASAHYTEHLIKLPNLGCLYSAMPVVPTEPDFHALAIDGTLPLLICPGVPYKYAPQHDCVLVDIARKLGRCQFIFFTHPVNKLSDLLQHRLRTVFTEAGLRYDALVVSVPWQEKAAFYGLMQRSDVYLDTIGFSGFNSAMQAVECGLPIVTREGRFMRGRFASGILKCMGLSELVAVTEEAYIALVVRLAKDAEYRQRMRERIQESRNVLFNDLAPIRALENFLGSVTDS